MSAASHAAFSRMRQLMSASPVPAISTELLVTADGELNREPGSFLSDPPSDPALLKGRRVAICSTNVSPRIGELHPTLGLRFPPQSRECRRHRAGRGLRR